MDKSIIVIDKPSRCVDCVCFIHCSLEYGILYAKELKANNKPIKEICKLKPMPEKDFTFPKDGYFMGWNDCIDQITGAEE